MIDRELLIKCGLNGTEQSVLLYLIKNGASSGGLIAKRLQSKRTTIYSALSSLESLGLVIRERGKRGAAYLAIDVELIPAVFKSRAEAQCQEVTQASEIIGKQLKTFSKAQKQHAFGSYNIISTESKEAISNLLLEILTRSGFCAIFDIDTVTKDPAMKSVLQSFMHQTAVSKHKIRDIVVEGKNLNWYLSGLDNINHQVKVVSKNYSIPTDIILADGIVFQTSYEKNQEMVIQIKHPAYYQSMQTVFDLIWENLPDCQG